MFEKIKAYIRGYPPAKQYRNLAPVGYGRAFNISPNADVIFATCVKILAQNLAQFRWTVYRPDSTAEPAAVPGSANVLNYQPYPGINAYTFWEYMEKQRLLYGNAFAYINCDRTTAVAALVPLDAGSMQVVWDDANILDGGRKLVYRYTDPRNGETYTILPDEILHFRAFSTNGILGRPAGAVLRDTLQANAEAEGAIRSTISNGFSGTIVLTYTSDLSKTKQKELQAQIKELLSNSNATILPLPAGMEASNITNDVGSYYQIVKESKAEDISALFGIPLAMLNRMGGTGAATFSASQMMQFFSQTIAPILEQYAAELSVKLLSERQRNAGLRFGTVNDVFDTLDAQSKASVLCSYTGAGILTPNEARASLKYPRLDTPEADMLTQRGGTGALGDSPGEEQGNEGGENGNDR